MQNTTIKKIESITPVQLVDGVYIKRDDLFAPFEGIPLNGGKLRQAFKLLGNNQHNIKTNHNNTVATFTSVHSPQGLIISMVAKYYGMNCYVLVGGTNEEVVNKNGLMKEINKLSTIKYCRAGYNTVLTKNLKDLCIAKNYFLINYGINMKGDKDAILTSVSNQVQNIPNNLDYLVVPVGSGITFTGILLGLKMFNKKVKNVVGIQISGKDLKSHIRKDLGIFNNIPFNFYVSKDYKYSQYSNISIGEIKLDVIYEGKAWDYFVKNFEYKDKKVCFWIVGNTNKIRSI